MNINSILLKLKNELKMNVYPDVNPSTTDEEWVVFEYDNEESINYADDIPTFDNATIQIHLFTPKNYMNYKTKIRNYLESNGFAGISSLATYEKDTKLHHIIFNCEYSQGRS